jgi:hypothetical protein
MGREPGQTGTYNGTTLKRVATCSAHSEHEEKERGEGSDLGVKVNAFALESCLGTTLGVRLLGREFGPCTGNSVSLRVRGGWRSARKGASIHWMYCPKLFHVV